MRIINPEPNPGLSAANFRKVCENGFGDRNNSYAYSMVWFRDRLYVGTCRTNLCFMSNTMKYVRIDVWPVYCPHPVYTPEFEYNQARAEIWRFDPGANYWEKVYQAPTIVGSEGEEFSRELGYRGMVVFKGESDKEPALYTSTLSRSRGAGPLILRSDDGINFVTVSQPGLVGLPINSLRSLIPFQGRIYTAPTGAPRGRPNTSGAPVIYESSDPASGQWRPVSEPGFGDPNNKTVWELVGFGDYLYAGTLHNSGFQLWRTRCEGNPPYHWENVISGGADRGSFNQATASMIVFKDALYIGTGIQNGGYDHLNKIGPAGAEIIRLDRDGSWELIVGDPRKGRRPLSGLASGFNSLCAGYIWRMGIHDNWLYAATFDWGVMLRFTQLERLPGRTQRLLQSVDVENIIKNQAGFSLWRTYDGENWIPVTRKGFGNPYNYGIRSILSTPYGLFVGTANPFGPQVATWIDDRWDYTDNPDGGLEVWLGNNKET